MAKDIPYGSRGYLIDRKGEITPINDMYGHEAFVKKRSKEYLSPINFVADNGWVLVQTVADHSVITLCDETVTRQALSATLRVMGVHHRGDKITVTNYNRDTDIENQLVSYATYVQVTKLFIKLKSGAETATFLETVEVASREAKLAILEEKAKVLILQKSFRVFHDIKGEAFKEKTVLLPMDNGGYRKYDRRSWEYLWTLIIRADPTKNKKYLQWVISKVIKNNSDWKTKRLSYWREDLEGIRHYLTRYDELKRTGKVPVEHRDINKFKDDFDLLNFINDLETKLEEESKGSIEEQEANFLDNKEAKIYYESSSLRVIIPSTPEASCFFGRKTNWCTAIPKRPQIFGEYSADGPLYIIEDKTTGLRYQFHFESEQFMNEQDHPVDFGSWHKEKYPILKELIKVFSKVATATNFTPLMKNPTVNSYIAMLDEGKSFYQVSGVIYIFSNHVYAKPSEKDKLNFLAGLVKLYTNTYGLSWFSTGAAEESLSKLFNIARNNFENEFPFVVLETNLSKDTTRALIIKTSRNADPKILDEIDKKFAYKFGENFYTHY